MDGTLYQAPIEVLVFEVGGQRFGILAGEVREVLRAVTLAVVPESMSYVDGIMNLRGRAVPVLDIRGQFRLRAQPVEHTDQFIVCEAGDRLLAVRAEGTIGLFQLMANQMEPAGIGPAFGPVAAVAKVPEGLILILDPVRLLPPVESGLPGPTLAELVSLEAPS